jgi:DNA-binding CsgD family transcriptional regulator
MIEHVNAGDLTESELQVLREVSAGYAKKEIAARLALSVETVKAPYEEYSVEVECQ